MTPDPYVTSGTVKDPGNLRMREASGRVDDPRPLVAFLYELVRDHLTTGALEERIDRLARADAGPFLFTNGWLAGWAQDAADRLTGRTTYPTPDSQP